MALDKCKEAISAAVGRELTKREEGIVSRRASELQKKIELANNDPIQVDSIIKEFSDDVAKNAALGKRTAALNYAAYATEKARWDSIPFYKKNPAEAWRGLFRGSNARYFGSRDSLAYRAFHESTARAGALQADLEKLGLTTYAFDGKDDLNIVRAMWDIRNEVPPDAAKYGKNAVAVAKILDKHQEALRQEHNAAGAFIARNSDRLYRRTHDANRIAKAGDNRWGSDASRTAWSKFVNDRIDWEKSFDGNLLHETDKERMDVLNQLWSDFSSHTHLKDGKQPPINLGQRNFGRKLSHARKIVMKGAREDLEYQRNFGSGASVTENVFNNLKGGGRDLALMQRLGPNPESTLRKLADSIKKSLDDEGNPKKIKEFGQSVDREFNNTWRLLTQMNAGHPEGGNVARFLSTIRQLTGTAAVGMATFSLPGDMALKASRMAHMTGAGVAKNLAATIKDQFSATGLSKAETYRLMAEHGIRIEGAHMPLDPDLVDHVGHGAVAKFNKLMMRFTPHAYWDNGLRVRSLVADGYRYWTLRDKSFAQLAAPVRDTFAEFGIDEKSWDVIRKSDGTKLDNDKFVYEPSDIRSLPLEKFKALVGGAAPSDAQLSRARERLTSQYRSLLGEKADRDVSAPSIANQANVGLGYERARPGTISGELWRGALQLKGWVFNYMHNHMGRELHGYGEFGGNYRTTGQAIVDMVRVWDKDNYNPRALGGMARLVAAGVPIALASNALRNLAAGKAPEDPTTLGAWLHAFERQSFGLYSEFLLQDVRPDSTIGERLYDMASGPEISFYSDIVNSGFRLAAQAESEEGITPEKLGSDEREWFQALWRRVPATQLFWDKFAFDYMVQNNLSEMMNPGYQQRLIDRQQKNGTPYLFGAGPQTAQ